MNPIFIEAMPRWSGFIFSAFEKRSQPTHQRVGYDKAHCEPIDWLETNQWVRESSL